MRVISRDDTFDAGEEFELWGLGDFHLGAPDFDEVALRRDIARIADHPNARVVLMGDYGDLIDPRRDRRSDGFPIPERYRDAMFKEGGIPTETVAHAAELLLPIRERIIGMLEGNHELSVRKYMDRSIASELAAELDVSGRLLGYGGFIHWKLRRRTSKAAGAAVVVTIHAHHGYQAGRRAGAKVNEAQLEKSRYPGADIILRGHAHDRIGHIYPAVDAAQYHVRDRSWAYVCTGTYKLGRVDTTINEQHHTTWEEMRGFHPKVAEKLGPPVVTVRPVVQTRDTNRRLFDLEVTV